MYTRFLTFCLSLLCLATPAFGSSLKSAGGYEILGERTHKTQAFTQGLFILNDEFYETSGLYKKSFIAEYPVTEPSSTWAKLSAPYTKKKTLPERYFAEGAAAFGSHIYILTWQESKVIVVKKEDFSLEKEIPIKGEGWGLTATDKSLIRSDGSDNLYFHNPLDFAIERQLAITLDTKPLLRINELEYHQGFIWANIWHENLIVKINPHDGKVVKYWDLSALTNKLALADSESVLNGIAYDPKRQAFWVTGKNWPKLFLVKFLD